MRQMKFNAFSFEHFSFKSAFEIGLSNCSGLHDLHEGN